MEWLGLGVGGVGGVGVCGRCRSGEGLGAGRCEIVAGWCMLSLRFSRHF